MTTEELERGYDPPQEEKPEGVYTLGNMLRGAKFFGGILVLLSAYQFSKDLKNIDSLWRPK